MSGSRRRILKSCRITRPAPNPYTTVAPNSKVHTLGAQPEVDQMQVGALFAAGRELLDQLAGSESQAGSGLDPLESCGFQSMLDEIIT